MICVTEEGRRAQAAAVVKAAVPRAEDLGVLAAGWRPAVTGVDEGHLSEVGSAPMEAPSRPAAHVAASRLGPRSGFRENVPQAGAGAGPAVIELGGAG